MVVPDVGYAAFRSLPRRMIGSSSDGGGRLLADLETPSQVLNEDDEDTGIPHAVRVSLVKKPLGRHGR